MATTSARVHAVTAVTPRMTRVRLVDDSLRGLAAVPGQTVKILVPDGDATASRDYTVRSFAPDVPALDIDFVLHGDGPAANWARVAEPGGSLEFVGPSGRYRPDPTAHWHLFAGDESALPAIQAMVEALPPDATVDAYVEIADAAEEQPVGGHQVRWLHRHDAPPGQYLEEALHAAPLPPGAGRIWLAGHTPTVQRIRARLLAERGVERRSLYAKGYWDRSGP